MNRRRINNSIQIVGAICAILCGVILVYGLPGDSSETPYGKEQSKLLEEAAANKTIFLTNFDSYEPLPLLVLSQRGYVHIGNCDFFRVTDREWQILTNEYPEKVETNIVLIYGKPKPK